MELTTLFKGKYLIPAYYAAHEAFDPALHTGTRLRLVFVEQGSGIVSLGGFRCAFIAPCLLCVSETEELELVAGAGLSARGFYFHPAFVNATFSFDNLRSGGTELTLTDEQDRAWLAPFFIRTESFHGYVGLGPIAAKRVAACFDGMEREVTSQPDYSVCRCRSYLLETAFMVSRMDSADELVREQPLPESESEVDQAILFLHTEYHRKITLDELSRAVHLSRTSLSERFARATGQPVMSYLTGLRMRLAALMLRETNLPVNEIMERVGFGNSSHFLRTFKRHAGMSPSGYRAEYCWMLRGTA